VRLFVIFALILMLGCSRKEPETASTAPPQPATEPAPVIRKDDVRPAIVALGDSISAGFGVPSGQSFPDHLQRELDRRNLEYRVVNAGISGDTTSGGLSRLNSVLAQKPEMVIVELGGNDGLRGLPIAATRRNLEEIVERLQADGVHVVLAGMTLPPNYGPDYIRSFEQVYQDLARKYKVTLIPFLLEGVAATELMQADGIHPTSEGHRKVAEIVAKAIDPLLRPPGK
jgi:acyl-CoA thioesterase-1